MAGGQSRTERALEGVKVVEFGQLVSGPYCGKMLADLGAEVIKVETPGTGDKARALGPFPDDLPHPERSALYSYLNTNKLGVTLDPATRAGREIFSRLLEHADILVENNRPAQMKVWRLDYDSIHRDHPNLIVTSVTPFGQTGPFRDYKACDLTIYHASGAGHTTPRAAVPGDRPIKVAGRLADFYAGQTAALAALCALWARDMTGEGQHVDLSAQEAFINNCWAFFTPYIFADDVVTRIGRPKWQPMAILRCQDGYVSFQFQSEAQWQSLMELMGKPDWAESELFSNQWARAENWDGLSLLMEEWLSEQTKEKFFHAAQANRCPVGPVNTAADVLRSEHLAAREFFAEVDHPVLGRLKQPSRPYQLSATPWRIDRPAPLLGEHNEEVYCGRLGLTKVDLVVLRGEGVI